MQPRQEARQGWGREACIVHSGETVKERWHGSAMGGMEAGPTECYCEARRSPGFLSRRVAQAERNRTEGGRTKEGPSEMEDRPTAGETGISRAAKESVG